MLMSKHIEDRMPTKEQDKTQFRREVYELAQPACHSDYLGLEVALSALYPRLVPLVLAVACDNN